MNRQLMKISKFLSRVLRHQPDKIGLMLDAQGWADVDQLLLKANQHGVALTRPLLKDVVEQNDKQRFAFSSDGTRIRANQGHSIKSASVTSFPRAFAPACRQAPAGPGYGIAGVQRLRSA